MLDQDIALVLLGFAFPAAVLLAAGLAVALAVVCARHRMCRHELARVSHARNQLELRLARIAPHVVDSTEQRA